MATFATWNPSDKSANITLSNGNLTATNPATGNYCGVRSDIGVSSGKHYWEFAYTSGASSDAMYGIANGSQSMADGQYVGLGANGWGNYRPTGNKLYNGGNTAYGSSQALNDVIMIALDMDNGEVYWGKNGTWFNSGNPASRTNPAFTGITGTIYAMVSLHYNNTPVGTANFGATTMTYTAPSGFRQGLYTGSIAVDVTVNATVVTSTFTIPSYTVTAIQNVTVSQGTPPNATFSIPTYSQVSSVSVTPAVQTATFTIPVYDIIIADVNISAPVQTCTFTIPSYTPDVTANPTVSPSVQVLTFTIPAYTITVTANISVSASVFTALFTIPSYSARGDFWENKFSASSTSWGNKF